MRLALVLALAGCQKEDPRVAAYRDARDFVCACHDRECRPRAEAVWEAYGRSLPPREIRDDVRALYEEMSACRRREATDLHERLAADALREQELSVAADRVRADLEVAEKALYDAKQRGASDAELARLDQDRREIAARYEKLVARGSWTSVEGSTR